MNKLEKQVLLQVGDDPDAPDVFTDTAQGIKPIRRSINDAIQEVIIINGGMLRTFYIPLTKGKTFYSININGGYLGWVINAWLVNIKRRIAQTDLHSLRKWDYRWYQSTGTPETYFPVGVNTLGFYPKPTSTADIAQIEAVVIPAPYTDDKQKVKLMKSFEWAVVNYAVSEYWASRGDADQARRHMQIYIDTLGLRSTFTPTGERIHQLRTDKTGDTPNEQESVAL